MYNFLKNPFFASSERFDKYFETHGTGKQKCSFFGISTINIDDFHGLEHPNLMDFGLGKLEKALSPRPDGVRGTSAALDRKEIHPRSLSDSF